MDLDRLERLARLRQSGALTEDEFQQQKAELLISSAPTGHVASDESSSPSERAYSRSKWPWIVATVLAIVVAAAVIGLVVRERSNSGPPPPHVEAGVTGNAVSRDGDSRPAAHQNHAAAVPRAPEYTAEQSRLIDEWKKANEMCRGSSDEQAIETWCPRRDEAMEALNRSGVCYGRETDQSAADYEMYLCGEGSYRD